MLKSRREAMDMVGGPLISAETAIDQAICAQAKLIDALVSARRHANLSAVVGHDAITACLEALDALRATRDRIVVTHHALAVVRDQIGLRAVAIGGAGEKPPQAPARQLEAVA